MRDDGRGGDEETPEVGPIPPFEGDEAEDYEFDGVVPRHSGKGSEDSGTSEVGVPRVLSQGRCDAGRGFGHCSHISLS